jgi:hypothetical protein
MNLFGKENCEKKKTNFLMPIIKLQPQSKKNEEGLKIIFLVLAFKFWNPILKVRNKLIFFMVFVATLALGSQPKQGVARLRAKRETKESLHMLMGVQRV